MTGKYLHMLKIGKKNGLQDFIFIFKETSSFIYPHTYEKKGKGEGGREKRKKKRKK